jgi:glycopeptide antibiotics resistance protein
MVDNPWLWGFGLFASLGAFAIVLFFLLFAFWIWMIVGCAQRRFNNHVEHILWIIVIVLGSTLGALVYYFVIKISNSAGLTHVPTATRIAPRTRAAKNSRR